MPGRCACTVQFTEKTLQKRLTKGGAAGIITHVAGHKLNMWGISSAGRALAWHARGQRFDPAILHQKSTVLRWKYGAFLFAEVGFWGLHCFSCTVFRLLQAVPIQPPTFDFTFHTSPGGDGPLLGANSPYSGCNAPDF